MDIDERLYYIFILVQSCIWLATIIKDNIKIKYTNPVSIAELKYCSRVLAIIGVGLSIYLIFKLNVQLLQPKNILLPQLGAKYLLLHYSAAISLILGYLERRRNVIIVSSVVLLFTFVIGERSPITLTVIALLVLYFQRYKKSQLITRHYKRIILISVFGYIIIMGKVFYGSIKSYGFIPGSVAGIKNLLDPHFIKYGFSSIEPFGIQTILNEIVVENYKIDFSFYSDILYQIMIIPSLFNVQTKTFNDIFQPDLFPEVTYGMAYNIWAEAIATGGGMFLFLVVIGFVLGIFVLDKLLHSKYSIVKAFASLSGAYWCFYIHRSSIAIELIYQRNILVTLVVGMLISCMLYIIRYKKM